MALRRVRRLGLLAVVAAFLTGPVGCTASDDARSAPAQEIAPLREPSSISYRFELESSGAEGRHQLVSALPVGRAAAVVVSLSSQGEAIDVELDAEVVRSAAGSSQDVELRVTAVRSDDPETVEGLRTIVGASSVLRRDERLAVVEQVLDVPDGLGFRADAIARQALRAPFALVGPLPLQPVGPGAAWTVTGVSEGGPDQVTEVALDESTPDRYVLSFEVADGTVEITGARGSLLPERQDIVLDDALVTITATRAN